LVEITVFDLTIVQQSTRQPTKERNCRIVPVVYAEGLLNQSDLCKVPVTKPMDKVLQPKEGEFILLCYLGSSYQANGQGIATHTGILAWSVILASSTYQANGQGIATALEVVPMH